MERRDIYGFVLDSLTPTEVARFYLDEEYKISGESLVYFSPLRQKERTPSFFVNDEIGLHDFGTGEHYNIISFVAELFEIEYWDAAKKIIIDFQLDLKNLMPEEMKSNYEVKDQKPKIKLVHGQTAYTIYCYFDQKRFENKPKGSNVVAGIKNRIINNNFKAYDGITEIKLEIVDGKTCIPSGIRGNPEQNWKQQQVFMIDFDNKKDGIDLTIDDEEHHSYIEVINYCKRIKLAPTIAYTTFSHTEKTHKFRLVYVFEKPITDINIAKQIPSYLIEKLKLFNPDMSKKNLSDIFFGGLDIIYASPYYYKVEIEE